jgi:hypothetical protein
MRRGAWDLLRTDRDEKGCLRSETHVGEEIEPSVVVEQERLGFTLLRPDVIGTLERVSNEKDGEVQADEIVVSILGVKLGSVSSRVSSAIGVFPSVSDRAQPGERRRLLAHAPEQLGFGQMRDVLGDDEFSESGPSGRVDDTFLDLGTVEGLLLLEEGGVGLDARIRQVELLQNLAFDLSSHVILR